MNQKNDALNLFMRLVIVENLRIQVKKFGPLGTSYKNLFIV